MAKKSLPDPVVTAKRYHIANDESHITQTPCTATFLAHKHSTDMF